MKILRADLAEATAHLGLADAVPGLTAAAERSDGLIERMRNGRGAAARTSRTDLRRTAGGGI